MYPYTAQDGNCAFDASKIAARLTNYTFATTPCESGSCPTQDDVLRHQLATVGPLSICVNAEVWSDWTGPSPLPASECPGDADDLDHCVQLVGYNVRYFTTLLPRSLAPSAHSSTQTALRSLTSGFVRVLFCFDQWTNKYWIVSASPLRCQ